MAVLLTIQFKERVLKNYITQTTGWISGTHYEAGAKLAMIESQAEYYVLNGQLLAEVVVAQPVPGKKAKAD